MPPFLFFSQGGGGGQETGQSAVKSADVQSVDQRVIELQRQRNIAGSVHFSPRENHDALVEGERRLGQRPEAVPRYAARADEVVPLPDGRIELAAFCGGDRLDDPVRLKMNELIERRGGTCRLYEGYGITEAAGVYSVNKRGAEREGSVGRPLCKAYQAEAYIDGKRQPRGVTGEICLSSPSLMKGYLGGDSSALFHDCGACQSVGRKCFPFGSRIGSGGRSRRGVSRRQGRRG